MKNDFLRGFKLLAKIFTDRLDALIMLKLWQKLSLLFFAFLLASFGFMLFVMWQVARWDFRWIMVSVAFYFIIKTLKDFDESQKPKK